MTIVGDKDCRFNVGDRFLSQRVDFVTNLAWASEFNLCFQCISIDKTKDFEVNYDTIPVNEKLRARDELINLYSSQSILIYLIFSVFHILLLCCGIFYILINTMVFYGEFDNLEGFLFVIYIFQLLVDYSGIFVAFDLLQVIYLSSLPNTKYQNRLYTWLSLFLCYWYRHAWYCVLYYGQFTLVSLDENMSCFKLAIGSNYIR